MPFRPIWAACVGLLRGVSRARTRRGPRTMVRQLPVRSIVLEPVNGPADDTFIDPHACGDKGGGEQRARAGDAVDPSTCRRNKRFPNHHADDVAASEQQLRFLTYPTVVRAMRSCCVAAGLGAWVGAGPGC